MPIPKYKKFVELMYQQNQRLFNQFQSIHDNFANSGQHEDQFHSVGRDVLDVVRDWERRLCYGTEKGKYASYSAQLAEKFRQEIKKTLPLLDQIGVTKTA